MNFSVLCQSYSVKLLNLKLPVFLIIVFEPFWGSLTSCRIFRIYILFSFISRSFDFESRLSDSEAEFLVKIEELFQKTFEIILR